MDKDAKIQGRATIGRSEFIFTQGEVFRKGPQPQRIQRKRVKGWRMPPDAVYVGRPTRFGNPYSLSEYSLEISMQLFSNTARGIWDPSIDANVFKLTYERHCAWLKRIGHHPVETIRSELRGKDLACFCPLSQKCHADILLEIANGRD